MSIHRGQQARSVLPIVAMACLLSGFPATTAAESGPTKTVGAASPTVPAPGGETAASESLPIKPWRSSDPEVLVVPAPVFPFSREGATRDEAATPEPIRKPAPDAGKKPAAPSTSSSESLPADVGEAKETFDRIDKALQELGDGPMHSNLRSEIGKARQEFRGAFDRYREDREDKPWENAVQTAENFIQDVENP